MNWRPVSIFSHRVAQIWCSPNNIFLAHTSKITFPRLISQCTLSEDRQYKMWKIILWHKYFWTKKITSLLILELHYFSWTEDPPVFWAMTLHRFYASQTTYFWKIQVKLNFRMHFEWRPSMKNVKNHFVTEIFLNEKIVFLLKIIFWFWSCIVFCELKTRQYF